MLCDKLFVKILLIHECDCTMSLLRSSVNRHFVLEDTTSFSCSCTEIQILNVTVVCNDGCDLLFHLRLSTGNNPK